MFPCAQIMLHGPGEKPMMLERGVKVSPGFATHISVTASHVRRTKLETLRLFTVHELSEHYPF